MLDEYRQSLTARERDFAPMVTFFEVPISTIGSICRRVSGGEGGGRRGYGENTGGEIKEEIEKGNGMESGMPEEGAHDHGPHAADGIEKLDLE